MTGALAACAALLSWNASAHAQGAPPAAVRVDAVKQESVQERSLVTGDLRAMRRSRVASQESGVIIELPLDEGVIVAKGDVLARLDSKRLSLDIEAMKAERDTAESVLEERQANLNWTRRDLDLLERTLAAQAARQKEVDDARSAMEMAQARVSQAERDIALMEARLALLQERLDDMVIRAPFNGVVVMLDTELGEWIGEGDPVAELVAIDQLEAWLSVPQRLLAAVQRTEEKVTVALDATGEEVPVGSQRSIPQVDERARTFTLIATLANANGALAPGMSITAWVPAGTRADALTISKDAIMRSELGAYVYVVRQMDPKQPPAAMPANVRVRFPLGERMVVTSGELRAGDMVVVEGNERLYPTAPVAPTPREERPVVSAAAGAETSAQPSLHAVQESIATGADVQ